jgi:hypothetical protein
VQASKRYAKANNIKTPDYDETKEKSWIIYQDCKYIFYFIFSNFVFFFFRQQLVRVGNVTVHALRWIQVG